MVVDFKNLNLHERPTLILRNMDCKAFGVLGRAFNLTADLKFNEMSDITFDYPATDNGERVPFYNDIKAMNIIDVKGLGQFIVISAKAESNGIREVKHCTAHSLECEMKYKQFFAAKGTYNLWNPVSPKGTIIGMILETMPYWSLGRMDASLIGKYRTFEAENINVLDFIKNTVQATYGCVFTFDTYTRTINVADIKSLIPTAQVYLSLDNLIKDIEITENSENLTTCIQAFGADDLNIRSVNPTGTNQIINLDYFMTEINVSKEIIDKWAVWKKLFDDRQFPYYNIMIDESIQTARLLTEKSVLTGMKGDLKKLETLQSTSVQYLGEHPHDVAEQAKLDKVNTDIAAQKLVIEAQEKLLVTIQGEIDTIGVEKKAINNELAFETSFTKDEIASFSKYIKEGTIQDPSFVVSAVKDYNTADASSKHENAVFDISSSAVTRIVHPTGKELYSMVGGNLTCPCGEAKLTADIVRSSMERKSDGSFVLSAYLNKGRIGDVSFPSGNISVTGVAGAVRTDVIPDPDVPDAYATGTNLSYTATTARVYFTQNATEYEARAVQFDLFEYAKSYLKGSSVPICSFTLEAANFLALREFIAFKNNFTLGQRVYLGTDSYGVLKPVVIGIKIDFESYQNFSLEFSDTFTTSETAFDIAGMIESSASAAKQFSRSLHSVGQFKDSGADYALDHYINTALDVAKKEILATVGQAISWDENGIRLRKWLADRSGYEPQQMWLNNNMLNFTSDNWDTVRTALGKVQIGDQTLYGLVAEVIVGHSILGKNFSISSEKEHGGIQEFRIDGAGVRIYNGAFYLTQDGGGQIVLTAGDGILLGTVGLFTFDENGVATVDKSKANMWLDMDGSIHLLHVIAQGDIVGSVIKGSEIYIGGDNTKENCKFGVDKAGNIIGLETLNGKLRIDADGKAFFDNDVHIGGSMDVSGDMDVSGNMYVSGNIVMTDNGNIQWTKSTFPGGSQFSVSATGPWHETMQANDAYKRDKLFDGSWGAPYKHKGEDGKPGADGSNGSDASVPKYITETIIGKGIIEAPRINANEFGVYPNNPYSTGGGFTLHGAVGGLTPEVFRIAYVGADPGPSVSITSESASHVYWETATLDISSDVNFGGKVSGVKVLFE